jgi:hypothetical protein
MKSVFRIMLDEKGGMQTEFIITLWAQHTVQLSLMPVSLLSGNSIIQSNSES